MGSSFVDSRPVEIDVVASVLRFATILLKCSGMRRLLSALIMDVCGTVSNALARSKKAR